jgi:hypothetical protein
MCHADELFYRLAIYTFGYTDKYMSVDVIIIILINVFLQA